MGGSFAQPWEAARPEPAPADRRQLLDSLARVSLPVTASLDTTLPARELLALAPGDVLALTRSVQEPVDVRVRGTTKFAGQLVRRDGAAGVMVTATVNGAGAYAG
jgi:flagellar motor switch protein FliM